MTVYVDVLNFAAPAYTYAVQLDLVAATVVSGHRVVRPRPSDAELAYASNLTLDDLQGPFMVTTGAAVAGAEVKVTAVGLITEPSWAWTPGEPIWLGDAGHLTQVVPVSPALFLARLGVALTATTIYFNPSPSLRLA